MKKNSLFIYFIFLGKVIFATEPISIKYLGIEQGLSNNAVTSVYQDHNGFMWFGTYDGLNKYDGYSFRVYRNMIGDSTSLANNHVYTVEGDANNNIWVGGIAGISVYNSEKSSFYNTRFQETVSKKIQNFHGEARVIRQVDEDVFAGTQLFGLILFEKSGLFGKQIAITSVKNTGNYNVSAIVYDKNRHVLWVFVNGIGLCRYDFSLKKLNIISTAISNANCMQITDSGDLWIGTENGMFGFNTQQGTVSKNMFASSIRVTDIVVDKKGELWISSDGNGLWIMPVLFEHPIPFSSVVKGDGINSNAIYDICEDSEGRKWIGTLRGGVNIIEAETSPFKNIVYNSNKADNIINNYILSFCEDDHSNLWIGTDGAGLRFWNRQNNGYTEFTHTEKASSLSSNFVTGITRDYQNELWVSTWFGGINRLDRANKSFKHYFCFNSVTNQAEDNVWLIYEDHKKRLWASATNNGCLYLFNRAADKFELFDPSVVNFQSLSEDKEGKLWGGTYNSLVLISVENKTHTIYDIGYPVRCIHEDRYNNFWIGTEGGGLLLFDRVKNTYNRITTKEGLPSNTILKILEDPKGNLWLSTYNGLCRFNPFSKNLRNFTQSDGLQSNQFSFNAALALHSGEFIFGGIKGFNIFFPDSVNDKKNITRLFMNGLRVDNTSIEENDSYVTERKLDQIQNISVPFEKAIVSIDFVALEYSKIDKMKYAYFLKGWDKNWNLVNNSRTANYSRLLEGNYFFYVKVMNGDGVWGDEKLLLTIKVLPPWYRTWLAYIFYLLSMVSVIYLYLLYNKKQERLKYEIKLAQLEKEKEKELSDKRIAFFTHVSHEFRTPLTLIINPLKELVLDKTNEAIHKKILMVQRNAKRLLSLIDQLLLFRKVESIDQQLRLERFDMTETCNEIFLSFSQHAAFKHVDFSFEKPDHEISVYGDKEKIEIILFNLLSNALKYTPADGHILFIIKEYDKNIEIVVKDSGSGIPSGVGNKIFESFYQAVNTDKLSKSGFGIGLYVSQKLANAHSGKLTYISEPGCGAEFTLTLLKGKQHFKNEPISEDYRSSETILHELVDDDTLDDNSGNQFIKFDEKSKSIEKVTSGLPTMLIVDDNSELRAYIRQIFEKNFNIYEADDGTTAFDLTEKEMPDIVISDVLMKKMGGIELCRKIKENNSLQHIPIILLTASTSEESKLKGIEFGADDYIMKPFEKDLLVARVNNLLKNKNNLQQYFFNEITFQKQTHKILKGDKIFLDLCIKIVENNLDKDDFTIKDFAIEIGMSHSSLYKKIKAVSGNSVNSFIRYIRLRKSAELLINTEKNVNEIALEVGINDIKYFREQFFKLFGINPSDYIKKYRKVLSKPSSNNNDDKTV